MNVITVHRPWYRRLIDRALDRLLALPQPRRHASRALRELDARTLADIGVDASEIDSIEAEAHGPGVGITRRRIVALQA